MVNIDFGDGYKLMQSDELNIILCKETVVENPKAKNYGNRVVRRMGYYGNLSQALNGYKNAKIMDKKIDCSNTNLLSELLRQIDETIRRCTRNEKERNAGLIKNNARSRRIYAGIRIQTGRGSGFEKPC